MMYVLSWIYLISYNLFWTGITDAGKGIYLKRAWKKVQCCTCKDWIRFEFVRYVNTRLPLTREYKYVCFACAFTLDKAKKILLPPGSRVCISNNFGLGGTVYEVQIDGSLQVWLEL